MRRGIDDRRYRQYRKYCRRRPKRGWFYIIKSNTGVYKYGCTKVGVKSRIKAARLNTGEDFKEIYTARCKDIYFVESMFRWAAGSYVDATENFGYEYFHLREDLATEDEILRMAEEVSYGRLR